MEVALPDSMSRWPFVVSIVKWCLCEIDHRSIYFTMAMTIERYMTVCHPFYHHSHAWPTRCYVLPILLFSLFYNIPRFFDLEANVETLATNSSNSTTQPVFNMTGLNSDHMQTFADNSSNFTYDYSLVTTEFRRNYYYYSIYVVSFVI